MPKTKKFRKLLKAVEKQYLDKPVPKMYQKKYGQVYQMDEVEGIAIAIAKRNRWRT